MGFMLLIPLKCVINIWEALSWADNYDHNETNASHCLHGNEDLKELWNFTIMFDYTTQTSRYCVKRKGGKHSARRTKNGKTQRSYRHQRLRNSQAFTFWCRYVMVGSVSPLLSYTEIVCPSTRLQRSQQEERLGPNQPQSWHWYLLVRKSSTMVYKVHILPG